MRRIVFLALLLLILPPWRTPPANCSLDGKADYVAWRYAAFHADRQEMYEVCAPGTYVGQEHPTIG